VRLSISCVVLTLAIGPLAVGAGAAGVSAGAHLGPTDVAQLPALAPTVVVHYGPGPLQTGELRMPKGRGPFPIAIIVHGGCFTKGFATLSYMAPLATALAQRGIATWNVEYRQVGDSGGGWPGTYLDWAAAADHVRKLAHTYPLDLSRVIVVGHSAGATAALWIAGRKSLPFNSPIRSADPIHVTSAIAIDGPGDLAGWVGSDAAICGKPVIVPLFGGTAQEVPDRYAQGSPRSLLPLGVPQVLVSSSVLTESDANAYRDAAAAKLDRATVLVLHDAGHFDMLAPGTTAWSPVERLILAAVGISPGPG